MPQRRWAKGLILGARLPISAAPLPPKTPVSGVEVAEGAKAYPEDLVAHLDTLHDRVGDAEVEIVRGKNGSLRAFLLDRSGNRREIPVTPHLWVRRAGVSPRYGTLFKSRTKGRSSEMKRTTIGILIAIGGIALGIGGWMLSPWGQGWLTGPSTPSKEELKALPNVPLPEGAKIAFGELGLKYLTREELEDLGLAEALDLDLEKIPYRADLELERWVFVLRMDAIPALTEPEFTTVTEGSAWLTDDDLVLGIVYEGLVRAYPVRILDRHEIVNDRFGKVPVLITYCPLCFSGAAFLRPVVAGRLLEFGVSGRLYNANLLMYDRQTGTLWSQFTGEPIAGPLVGKVSRLTRIPLDVVSWGEWKAAHPNTEVLARPTRVRTPTRTLTFSPERYERYAYDEYRLKPQVGFGVDIRELPLRGVNSKRKVVGLVVGGRAMAYEEHVLKREGLINDVIGGQPVVIFHAPDDRIRAFLRTVGSRTLTFRLVGDVLVDEETGTRWSLDGAPVEGPLARSDALEELVVHSAFWFAWVAFYPDSGLYSGRN